MKAIQRVKQYIDFKGLNNSTFEKKIELSNGYIGTQIKRNADLGEGVLIKILDNCLDINPEWLLTGKGEMLKSSKEYKQESFQKSKIDEPKTHYGNTVPLYDIEATAGVFEVFNNNPQSIPIEHITIPNLPKCDGALYIRGDSMYPLLKSGDIVAFKTIHDKYNIIWGEMYLIYIVHNGDEYFFCKFLKKSSREGYAEFISHNQHHQSVEFPLDSIKALALVKASIRFNTLY
ncbi:S24 family peptidase [Chryseobacterium salviniae]|uniref:S24 family peptidase n=1 Tax=Chryseobacterium salviniae TaxID=3101750 RepID=A0ABU6HSU1_9FLAO|nr:S24 family peptidase [Chryseobacterium sp. T9W2-O]MEC3875973.1 S24 family peptidase [Chryseobacterium sp. T9W2-O]